jgi:hypothetical protein
MASVVVVVGVFAIAGISVFASEMNVMDQTKGLIGVAASCDDLKVAELKRDFPEKSRGLGLAFKPYAEGLEKCETLVGRDRRSVRSIFGTSFDADRSADSWVIGSGSGFFDEARSMAIFYSKDGLVTRVELSP